MVNWLIIVEERSCWKKSASFANRLSPLQGITAKIEFIALEYAITSIIILSQNVWYAIKNLLTIRQKKEDFVALAALTKVDSPMFLILVSIAGNLFLL